MTHERPIEELLRIVGSDRSQHTPEQVRLAENELRVRSGAPPQTAVRRLRRAGTIAAALGLPIGLWPAFVLAMVFRDIGPHGGPFEDVGMGGVPPLLVVGAACSVQTVAGLLLFIGGLGLRRRKEWGRKTLLGVVWLALALCVISACAWLVTVPLTMGFGAEALGFAVFGIAIQGIWVLVLWIPKRYLSSYEVKTLCRESGPRSGS